jgi:methylenetetrahydrofolate reductase (NADPH)
LAITQQLAKAGLCPMAHLTCVGATEEKIAQFLSRLDAAGVKNVLALRGDPPQGSEVDWASETFSYASDLVRFVRQHFPHFGIGVAAYPAPHPQSVSFTSDRQYTKTKLDAGGDFAITQLFFDAREYFEFVEQMRGIGVNKPIIPGVLPIQSLESIRRILSLSGGNIPAKLYLSLEAAHEKGGPEAVKEAGIAFAVEQIQRLVAGGAPGIHLYTLNQAETCLRIAEAVGPLG